MWEGINTQETLSFKYTAPVGWAQLKNDAIGGFTLIITEQSYNVAWLNVMCAGPGEAQAASI